jgi:3-hydroxybutyryl-CoA dehydrogenase
MRVLVFGGELNFRELRKKLPDSAEIVHHSDVQAFREPLNDYSLIIDYTFDDQPEVIEEYQTVEGPLILLNNVKSSLAELWYVSGGWDGRIAGFNGLPGFTVRELWEVTSLDESPDFSELDSLNVHWERVEDRVGMVAPRVICMIINEAFYTVQEGTADRESINMAMKLGTGYPKGPFEWADSIGIHHVYEVLAALFEDTGEERYKICPLLKKEYLLNV